MARKEGCTFTLALCTLKCVMFVYDVVTFPIYFLIQNPIGYMIRQKRLRAKVIDRGPNYVTYESIVTHTSLHRELDQNHVDTMPKLFDYLVKKYSKKDCIGTRQVLGEEDEIQPNGKSFKKLVLGDYFWKSYVDVLSLSKAFGRGLRELGIRPMNNIVIFADTRAEWTIAAYGIFRQSMPLVTIYATLGDEAIIHSLNETEAETVVTTFELLPKFKNLLPHTLRVKRIIYMEDQLKTLENTNGYRENVEIISFQTVIKNGLISKIEDVLPTGDDIAIIMYTSGSTGVPKGVLLQHKNLLGTVKGFSDVLNEKQFTDNETMLGYLPLAHVFELLTEASVMALGVRVGYSGPLTMIDSSTKIKKGTKGDAPVLRPTFTTGVPLVMDRIAKGIKDKVDSSGFLTRLLFKFTYNYKAAWTRRGFSTPIADRLVFGNVRAMLGGKLKLIITGGAALTQETHEFVRNCLCIHMMQGYGLTETTSGTSCQDMDDHSFGRTGIVLTTLKLKLESWEEGNYRADDRPNPRGEVVVGGECVSAGYYKQPEKTLEEFYDEDGLRWFRTGDIGEVEKDGVLKVIDRKKDLVKLQHGEYVSLGKVESLLKTSTLVDNVCVYGESTKNFCIAIVSPNPAPLKQLAEKLGVQKSFEKLCEDETIVKATLEDLTSHAISCKLNKFEIPAAIVLVSEPWTPESGLVTAALKIKRKSIQEYYQKEINRIYS